MWTSCELRKYRKINWGVHSYCTSLLSYHMCCVFLRITSEAERKRSSLLDCGLVM
eukprot:COSAG02_NODE_4995_length_4738_cov_4.922182_3_plen_55_part_00